VAVGAAVMVGAAVGTKVEGSGTAVVGEGIGTGTAVVGGGIGTAVGAAAVVGASVGAKVEGLGTALVGGGISAAVGAATAVSPCKGAPDLSTPVGFDVCSRPTGPSVSFVADTAPLAFDGAVCSAGTEVGVAVGAAAVMDASVGTKVEGSGTAVVGGGIGTAAGAAVAACVLFRPLALIIARRQAFASSTDSAFSSMVPQDSQFSVPMIVTIFPTLVISTLSRSIEARTSLEDGDLAYVR